MKNVVICADDFGYSKDINEGILKLLELKSINATSCMTNMDFFTNDFCSKLLEIENIDIGIHFNLTEGTTKNYIKYLTHKNCKFIGINSLLKNTHSRIIKEKDIYNELKNQLEKFIKVLKKNPDFIDGHQHIHHFPIIRRVIINLYKEFNLYQSKTYIRSVKNLKADNSIKGKIIKYSGSLKMEKLLKKNNIKFNDNFAGVYNLLKSPKNFELIFSNILNKIEDKALIMCHPSNLYNEKDILKKTRLQEYKYFLSNEYKKDLKNHNIILKKGNEIF